MDKILIPLSDGTLEERNYYKLEIEQMEAEFVNDGTKNFEIRRENVDYQAGDIIQYQVVAILQKGGRASSFYSSEPATFIKKEMSEHPLNNKFFEITYVAKDDGLKEGYVIFGIKEYDFFNAIMKNILENDKEYEKE